MTFEYSLVGRKERQSGRCQTAGRTYAHGLNCHINLIKLKSDKGTELMLFQK